MCTIEILTERSLDMAKRAGDSSVGSWGSSNEDRNQLPRLGCSDLEIRLLKQLTIETVKEKYKSKVSD